MNGRVYISNNSRLLKHLKRRRPKNLAKKLFEPVSMERKPFVLKKWTSPFDEFKVKKLRYLLLPIKTLCIF